MIRGIAIDIAQEEIQRLEALGEACIELHPIRARHHPRKAVGRNDALVRFIVPIDREGDALVRERARNALLDVGKILPEKSQ